MDFCIWAIYIKEHISVQSIPDVNKNLVALARPRMNIAFLRIHGSKYVKLEISQQLRFPG